MFFSVGRCHTYHSVVHVIVRQASSATFAIGGLVGRVEWPTGVEID